MSALPVGEPPPLSLIESGVAAVARRAKKRAERTGRPPVATWWVAELFGTVAALATFTVGAFLYLLPVVAYAVLGVSLLLIDTKISGARRRRAAAARTQPVEPEQQPSTSVTRPVRYQ